MLLHVLASYEVRPIAAEYCPPLHLQQLRRALVSKDELKQVERVIKQVPAKKLSLRTIEELSRKIQRYSRDEMKEFVLRCAGDFFHLHRDLRDADHLITAMERINLVTTEKARELSRMNNRLYECVLQDEARPMQDNVISHVIIKADVRGSTRMTQDLLSRGLNPASHFSLNLHEPVKKLLDRYDAKKVFIEGDAIILAIFETESSVAYARPVATASRGMQFLQRTRFFERPARPRAWFGGGISGRRAHLLGGRRFAHHDLKGPQSLRSPLRLRQAGQAHARQTEIGFLGLSVPEHHGRRFCRRIG